MEKERRWLIAFIGCSAFVQQQSDFMRFHEVLLPQSGNQSGLNPPEMAFKEARTDLE
jgi:hypothetical protein